MQIAMDNKHTEDMMDYESQDYVISLSPKEFEKHCKDILLGFAEETKLQDFQIQHDVKLEAHDGKYQIDVYASFTVMMMDFKMVCECKQYKNPVKREVIANLNQKIQSLGFQKGVLMSTSSFQSGAIEFTKEHGIALIRVFDYSYKSFSHSSGSSNEDLNDPFLVSERMMPPVKAYYYDPDNEEAVKVYPTHRMIKEILEKQKCLLRECGYRL